MDLHWLDPNALAERDIAGAVAVLEMARLVDAPHRLAPTTASYEADLRFGWDGHPARTALATDQRGRVIGVLEVDLPHWDNPHLAGIGVTVEPDSRRRGIGTALFGAGVDWARAHGRTLVVADCWESAIGVGAAGDAPGVGFAKAMGLDRASEAVKRTQDPAALDWTRLDALRVAALEHAGDYDFVRIAGRTPPELLDETARMSEAINDAPLDDLDIEDEVFTPERVTGFESAQLARGRRLYRVAGRHTGTGALVGHTMVMVEGERPWQAWQLDTSVVRAHRGHRLGVLLKLDMLAWLREAEPQLRTLDTGNAASNAHMIGINEILGYRVVAHAIEWQRHL